MQPAGEPGKTGGGFATALLSLDAHRGDMGRGGWGVQMALETQQRVQRTSHTPRMQHQKTRPEKPTDHGGVLKEPSGSVKARMVNFRAPPLPSTNLLLCLTATVPCTPGMAASPRSVLCPGCCQHPCLQLHCSEATPDSQPCPV